jgi:hypothetical protein
MKRNVTVQLDESVIHKARALARRRATSISQLVAEEILGLVETDDDYQRAQAAALAQLERPFHMGGGSLPTRESLHEP